MNKNFIQKDIMEFVVEPDQETIDKYESVFEMVNKSLRKDTLRFIEEERKRLHENAYEAETYMLM